MTSKNNSASDTSKIVTEVLDKYLQALQADSDIEDAAATRLDALLRSGKPPKPEEIDAVINPSAKDNES